MGVECTFEACSDSDDLRIDEGYQGRCVQILRQLEVRAVGAVVDRIPGAGDAGDGSGGELKDDLRVNAVLDAVPSRPPNPDIQLGHSDSIDVRLPEPEFRLREC